MKNKKFSKKLTLKKESIANLNLIEMKGINGGDQLSEEQTPCATEGVTICPTCDPTCPETCYTTYYSNPLCP